MPQENRNREFARAALCAAFGVVLVFAGRTAVFAGDATARFVREPPRNTLSEPPTGYRTPSPVQPYAIDGNTANEKTTPKNRQTGEIGKQ